MSTGAGRPRDQNIDAAVLAAVREELLAVGYAALTIGAVAQRAGTAKTTLYRRWSGKAELVHAATFSTVTSMAAPTGDIAEDIAAMVALARDVFADPVTRAALPGLIADTSSDADLSARVHGKFAEVFAEVRARLVAAVEQGEVHEDVDPDRLIEALGGAAMLRSLLIPPGVDATDVFDDDWVDHMTELLLHGIGVDRG